jgi:Leucine-rich repeat (LRR) protein
LCKFKDDKKNGYSCQITNFFKTDELDELEHSHLTNKTDENIKFVSLRNHPIPVEFTDIFEKFRNVEKIEMWKTSKETLETFGSCSKLKTFDMRFNLLSKLTVWVFNRCVSLEKIILNNNRISDVHELAFDGLKKLQFLDLSFNKISVIPPMTFSNSNNLKVLKLSHNSLALSTSLYFLLNFKSLKVLDLKHNKLNVFNSAIIETHTALKELHLNENNLSVFVPPTNGNLAIVSYLNLSDNKLSCLSIEHLKNIQYLDVSDNKIQSMFLSEKNRLREFHAIGNECFDESFGDIRNFTNEVKPKLKNCNVICSNKKKIEERF